jgi:hypothetical protein
MFFFLYITNTYKYSPFLFGCLLFRRWSLSFRNLLSCHTVSRVCHCQSHSDEQSANIDYENLKTFGCSLGNIIKAISYACNTKRHGTEQHVLTHTTNLFVHLSRRVSMETTKREEKKRTDVRSTNRQEKCRKIESYKN